MTEPAGAGPPSPGAPDAPSRGPTALPASPRPASAPGEAGAPPQAGLPPEVARAAANAENRIGRYVVLGSLGAGGMGTVVRAYDTALRRPVAIKLIGGDSEATATQLRRFEREAVAAARLRHPGIVAVHEVGHDRGRPFLVMELVDGESLEKNLSVGAPSPRAIAALVRKVALALDHAHGHGVVHRDVKPANVIVDRQGEPHLADFGVACLISADDARITMTGQMVGTPAYMAPEQAQGGFGEIGPRSDVYALGGILYRALVGEPPFQDTELLGLVRRILVEEPVAPRQRNAAVHPDLETIALQCLEKDPARRYLTAAALADDLGRFENGEPIAARPPGRAERWRRWARRNRALALALATCVVLVVALVATVVGGAVYALGRIQDQERRASAAREAAAAAQLEAEATRDDARRTKAALEGLVARSLVAIGGREWENHERIAAELRWARSLIDDDDPRVRGRILGARAGRLALVAVRRGSAPFAGVAIDRGGRRLAATRGEALLLWDLDRPSPFEADPSPVELPDAGALGALAFDETGERLAVAGKDRAIRVVDVASGRVTAVLTGHTGGIADLAWDGGPSLASAGRDGTVRIWDLASGEAEVIESPVKRSRLGKERKGVSAVDWSPDGVLTWGDVNGHLLERRPGEAPFRLVDSLHLASFGDIAVAPDGAVLASGGPDHHLAIVSPGRRSRHLGASIKNGRGIGGVGWLADRILATADHEGGLELRSVVAGGPQVLARVQLGGRARGLALGGRWLAIHDDDGRLALWRRRDGGARVLLGHSDWAWDMPGLAVSADGAVVASGGRDAAARVWDARSGELTHTVTLGEKENVRVALTSDGAILAATINTSKPRGRIELVDARSGNRLETLDGPRPLRDLVFSPDDRWLAAVDGGGVTLWSLATKTATHRIDLRGGAPAWSPDGLALAVIGGEETIVFEVGDELVELARHPEPGLVGSFSGDGRLLALGRMVSRSAVEREALVRVLDASTGELVAEIPLGPRRLLDLAFDPRGGRFAAALDRVIALHDVGTGELLAEVSGPDDELQRVAWSGSGNLLVATARDRTVRVWEAATIDDVIAATPRQLLEMTEADTGFRLDERLEVVPLRVIDER